MKWLVWDFDGTLAYRVGEWPAWTQTLLEVLDRETPGHGVDPELVRPFLRKGFPWHSPEVHHPHLASADAWWGALKPRFADAFRAAGAEEVRASEMAKAVRSAYLDPERWRLYEDAIPVHEERLAALVILVRRFAHADEQEWRRIYDLYLRNTAHVNSWDLVDASAPHIVGIHLLDRGRSERRVLDRLASSPLVWERRISVMATFAFVRTGKYDDTLRLAGVLLNDEHHLIQKAVGWMLRAVGKRDEPLLVGFLQRHSGDMPRTILRYSVERLDVPLRARLMAVRPHRATSVGASNPE